MDTSPSPLLPEIPGGEGTAAASPPEAAPEKGSDLFHGPPSAERVVFYIAAAFNVFALPFVWTWAILCLALPRLRPPAADPRRGWLRAAILLGSFDLILLGIIGGRQSGEPRTGPENARPRALGVIIEEKDSHLIVRRTLPRTAADAQGLRPGDEVNAVDERTVRSLRDLNAALSSPGEKKEVAYFRQGELRRAEVTLAAEPPYLTEDRAGEDAFRGGDLPEARKAFERAREAYPGPGDDVAALRGLAMVLVREGDLGRARELLDRAVASASPFEREGLLPIGTVLALRSGDAARAARLLEEIEDPRLKGILSPGVHLLEGEPGKAIRAWLRSIADGPALFILPAILFVLLALAMVRPDRAGSRLFLSSSGVLIGAVALGLLAQMAYGWLVHRNPAASSLPTLYPPDVAGAVVLEPLALLLLTALAGRAGREGRGPAMGFTALPPAKLLGAAMAGLCLLYGASLRIGLAVLAIRGPQAASAVHPLAELAASQPQFLVWLLPSVALIGPLAEEAFFRGFLHVRLRSRLGAPRAIAGSALVFGLLHPISVEYVVAATCLGLVLGYLRERSGSLLPPILAHCLFNAANFTLRVAASPSPW